MTYDELCESVLEAKRRMEELHAEPTAITLSPSAFNVLCEGSPNKPTLFGLDIYVADMPLGGFCVH